MKILHVCKKYPDALGGDAVVVSNLVNQQQKSGHNVSVLTSNCEEIVNSEIVYKFGLKDTPSNLDKITLKRIASLLVLFFKAYGIIKHTKPDIIHTHSVDMACIISFAARHFHVPIVHTFHIVTFNDKRQSLIRRKTELLLLRLSGPKIVTAPNMYEVRSLRSAGVKNAQLLPNGVDLSQWGRNEKIKKSNKFQFVSVGRLEAQKDFESLISAVKILSEDNTVKFHLTIVGDGSKKQFLNNKIKQLKLTSVVDIKPPLTQQELNSLYAKSDCFVIASLWETTPLTFLEACAAGLPVISTKVGILREESENRIALLVDISNINSLASAMRQIILNYDLAIALNHQSMMEIMKKYTWEHISDNLNQKYEKLI